jgi:hypothetical protein
MKPFERISIPDETSEFGQAHFRATIEFSQILIRSLILLNGGAILAILTFIGNFAERPEMQGQLAQISGSIGSFVVGLGLALVGTLLAYLTMVFQRGRLGEGASKALHAGAWFAGMLALIASFVYFALGAYGALAAFGL